jgi:hypothetical protein
MESQATIGNNRLIDLELAVHGKEVDDKSNNLVPKDQVIAERQLWSGKLDLLRNKHSQTLMKSKDDCNLLVTANNAKMTKLMTVKDSKMKRMMTTKDNEMKRMIIAKDNKINKLNSGIITLKELATKDKTLMDKMKWRIMAKDKEINKLNTVILRFKGLVTSLKELERGQKEDMECMCFDHWMEQRDTRRKLNNVICTKKSVIKKMHELIIDQREMTNEMLDEVIDAKKAARFMEKSQQCHQLFNVTFEED